MQTLFEGTIRNEVFAVPEVALLSIPSRPASARPALRATFLRVAQSA